MASRFRVFSLLLLLLFATTRVSESHLIGNRLNFPRLSSEEDGLTGIAIVNPSSVDALVALTAYGADGRLLQGPGIQNPVTIVVKSNAQFAKLASEIFGQGLPPVKAAWFQAVTFSVNLTGFFSVLNSSVSALDGSDTPGDTTQTVVFNTIRTGSAWSTEVDLVNPDSTTATVRLQLISPGSAPLERAIEIPPDGAARLDAAAFFDVSALSPAAYLVADSTTRLFGFELLRKSAGDVIGLNARNFGDLFSTLHFPQLAVLGAWKSEIGVVNYTSQPVSLTITAFRPDGDLYAGQVTQNPVMRNLDARGSMREDVETLFGFSGANTLDGWIKVESAASAVNGYISYENLESGSVAAVSASNSLQRGFCSHIGTAAGYFTGLALVNPNVSASRVRVMAMKSDGSMSGYFDTIVLPRQRISRLINEIIPGADNQSGGFLWINSELPIVASSVFGNSRALANIPVQPAPLSYKPDSNLPPLF